MICSVISAKGQSLKEVVGQAETDTANVYLPADSLFARFLKEKQIPVTACNRMTLLKSGRSKFEHLFEDIKTLFFLLSASVFSFLGKRPCVQFETHLCLRSNVLAFQVKRTCVLERTHLRFGGVLRLRVLS